MAIPILMPALSPTMEHGRLAKWLVKEGDSVSPGDVIAEIETDKATMEVEATDEGTVARIVVPEGTDNVPVKAVIAVLAEEGEDPASVEMPEAAARAQAPVGDGTETAPDESAVTAGTAKKMTSGEPVKKAVKAISEGVKAPAPSAAASGAGAAGLSDDQVFALYEEGSYDLVPLDSMRRTIAELASSTGCLRRGRASTLRLRRMPRAGRNGSSRSTISSSRHGPWR